MTDRPSSTDSAFPTDSGSGGTTSSGPTPSGSTASEPTTSATSPGSASGPTASTSAPGGAATGSAAPRPKAPKSPPPPPPPGLRDQFGRTRVAAVGLAKAHVDLAKSEFSEIIGEIKKAVMLGSIALGLLFVAATILTVGSVLWLDEWWFGSMGWGVLHGTQIFVALAVLLVLAIVDLSPGRALLSLLLAAIVGAIVGVVLGLDYRQIGDQNFAGLAENTRPLVLGLATGAIVVGVFGLLIGGYGGGARGAIGGLVAGAILGLLLGWLGSAHPGVQIAVAIGLAVALLLWPILAAILVFRHGIDTAKLKDRFVPDQTIDTTKETIEWVRAQTPLGRKS